MATEHIIQTNSYQVWRRNGKLHREDGPAVVYESGAQEYWLDDKRHCVEGPAIIWANGSQEWWYEGKRHREGGPAIMLADGTHEWWYEGKRHREDGPALIAIYGVAYYVNGVVIRFESYKPEIHDKFRFVGGRHTKAARREYLE
jgi:hypothetical protein